MLRTDLIRPIGELLDRHAAERGPVTAFVDDERRITYAELARTTARLAGHLVDAGLRPGDPVAMVMGNRVETAETYLAIPRAGGVATCLNPDAAPAELAVMLADCGARVVVTDTGHAELVAGLVDPGTTVVVAGGSRPGWLSYDDLVTADPRTPAPDPEDLDATAFMLYTSGTTGRPKGVELTLRSCLWVVAACWAPIAGIGAGDEVLCVLPLFHSYALDCACSPSSRPARANGSSPASPRAGCWSCSPRAGPPCCPGYRPCSRTWCRPRGTDPAAPAAGRDLGRRDPARGVGPGLRGVLRGPAARRVRHHRDLDDGHHELAARRAVLGSCGLPMPGLSVRLVDPVTGVDAPAGGEGELWVRGPSVMRGYHGRPEQTAEVLLDGWYRTGDLARSDPHGYLTICGRTKEMIIRGGENIYPAEIENVLQRAPGVADAAVVGAPHPDLGEVPVAFVVTAGSDAPDEDGLRAFCGRELTSFKVPAAIRFTDAIPRTGSGKVKRFELARLLDAAPTAAGVPS